MEGIFHSVTWFVHCQGTLSPQTKTTCSSPQGSILRFSENSLLPAITPRRLLLPLWLLPVLYQVGYAWPGILKCLSVCPGTPDHRWPYKG